MRLRADYPAIDLDGAVVAITGGARGIGRATARAFIARGAKVAIGDLDGAVVDATAAEVGAMGYVLDVTDRASVDNFVSSVERDLGPVDVFVNNAGVMPVIRFLEEDDRVSATTLNVNLWGPINGMRAVLPGMMHRGRGHVVNVASLAGKTHVPGAAVYNASKFGVVGLSLAVRAEVENSGVSVSTILPSGVRTELTSGISAKGGLMVEPETIARAVVDTVHTRRVETAVPRLMGTAVTVANLLPHPVNRLLRKALKDDRGVEAVDAVARQAYLQRVSDQAVGQSVKRG
ncbi:SDR family oxidoreductase [Mycobacterium sp. HM-7]